MARSRYSSGGSGNFEPKVDRDPFYKTLGIFNNIFKKKFKIVPDSHHATDCKENIYVNFGETFYSNIVSFCRPGERDGKSIYMLACGHEWEGNAGHPVDGSKPGACWTCGTRQAYLGFEHEWQHIIFKSNISTQYLFSEGYADQLQKIAPHVDRNELILFVKMMVNAFDDLRCNSLWEKVYPGSADLIWQRWTRIATERRDEFNNNFLMFIFGVALGVPTDPSGKFEHLRPVIEWAASKVKYRGFGNMLTQVRVVIEYSIAAILAAMPPAPPPQPPPQPQPQQQDPQDAQKQQASPQGSAGAGRSEPSPQAQPGPPGQHQQSGQLRPDVRPGDHAAGGQDDGGTDPDPVPGQPSGSSPADGRPGAGGGAPQEDGKAAALQTLIAGAKPLDKQEAHLDADFVDKDLASKSNALRAMVAKVLSGDINDLQGIDQNMPTGVPDQDMQATIDFVNQSIAQVTGSLTNDAKALVTIIEVPASGISASAIVKLEPETKNSILSMRAAFFKAMGRQRAKRASEGSEIDVQAYLQYKLDRQDPDVFISEEVQQGFSYSIVCDMSGSMSSTFSQVAQASEMLRESLDFPFVRGDVWGFRGGDGGKAGEVWLYKYAADVRGYIGTGFSQNARGRWEYPVKCGGVTPLNTAINVTAKHQHQCVSEGMAKRMFLLTDGSPMQMKSNRDGISPDALMRFVAKEILKARSRGIQVFTVVIGENSIREDDCLKMFGPRKFWRRVPTRDTGKALAGLVLDNFQKYLRHKG